MGTIKATNIEPIADNGTVTLGSSGDTITVPTGVTVSGASANTPSFRATMGSNQTLGTASWTKLAFNTVDFATGTFDTSNYRWTPGVSGKYFIYTHSLIGTMSDGNQCLGQIYKNGVSTPVTILKNQIPIADSNYMQGIGVITLDTDDYVEAYGWQNSGGNRDTNKEYTVFFGSRLIGV